MINWLRFTIKMLPRANYFQGILQLRDVNDEVISFVLNQIKKRKDEVAITKTVTLHNGFDLYLTSQKFIRILGKKLKENFGGELKLSSKLHTRNREGKDLYRINVMFRLLKIRKGSIVTVRGEEVKIMRLGHKIFAKSMKTGRKMTIRSGDLPKD